MSVNYNDTSATIVKYNNTELDKIIYNTTTVYQRITVNYYCENTVYRSVKVISGNSVDLSSNNAASKSGWSFIGWRTDKTANGTVQSSITAGTSTINLYAVYRQTITLTYNGNGATGGSTASQSGYRYYNNGNITNPSFTLRSNGFSRTNYRFVNWRMGSASGTAYNAGSSVTLSSNTTFYAAWQATVIRAYTFSRDSDKYASQGDHNESYLEFANCGYVGTGMSIGYDNFGQSIRLIPSRSGNLNFILTVQNQTSAGLSCNCTILVDNKKPFSKKISANTTVSFESGKIYVSSGQIINIQNDGQNAWMIVKAGSHIDWV